MNDFKLEKKQIIICLSVLLTSINTFAFTPEIKTIILNDGEEITARLCLPNNEVKTIVFCIPGTGANTFLNKRGTFNFYDELAIGFCEQGLAFFTYNRRGCQDGETPPFFVDVDSTKYAKYTPIQEAEDVESIIKFVVKDKRFSSSKIIIYGLSEGTIIASLVAERGNVKIDALLLHGYAHENMYDIIQWQDEGYGDMIIANSIFDKNNDKVISREEYENKDAKVSAYREYLFKNMSFDSLNADGNNFIDIQDIRTKHAPRHNKLMRSIADNDWFWIRNNYFNITPQWFKIHFALEPNKTRLLKLNLPIHIFHGTEDANAPVESVYDLQVRFAVCNKTNLTVYIFEKHNHDLNFENWLIYKKWSEGFSEIFSVAKNI
jgi:pimeloyl-ACP methyl ester carboxylesterase